MALLVLGSLACGLSETPLNVVVIVVDTLRADRLGFLGYPRETSPNLDRLAARGTAFTRAWTPVPVTLPAVTSLLTGRLPHEHGVRDNEHYVLRDAETTLAERLRDAGWSTAAVVASSVIASDRNLDQGFDHYDDDFGPPYEVFNPALALFAEDFATTRRRATTVTDRALEVVQALGTKPYFLFVHYFDVHSYYDPPPRYAARFPDSAYDGEIAYADAEIGRLLAALDPATTLIALVADHGEGLGDHGEPEHGFLLYESTLHVPLILAGPGIPEGVRRDDPVSLVDVEPTLAARLGLPAASPARSGVAIDWAGDVDPQRVLYAETFRTLVSYRWSELRSVRRDARKLIVGGGVTEVYDLAADPGEIADRSDADPAEDLQAALRVVTGGETREDVLEALSADPDPGRRALLESLGYLSGSQDPDPADPSGLAAVPHPREALAQWLVAQQTKRRYRRGLLLASSGEPAAALALFDSVLVREPGRADAYFNRALVHRKLDDAEGYARDLEASLARNPDYVPALAAKARDADLAGDPGGARELYERVLALEPAHEVALSRLAQALLEEGAFEDALPYLRRLVSGEPENPAHRFNLGMAALQAGRPAEGRPHLERFLELAPGDARAPAANGALRSLGGS